MPRADPRDKRCAIYTRKSSEEGLEQEFNSLAAQREACEAYIRSQCHEGWILARTRYDDGGFSGGNTERPALQGLLADIRAGRIDIVVVYKVDRLTRSLADFARLVEIFDAQRVSFVSVTQQFNTTSSMGRLTLNVLLSFAQFEREVTGERIRDKIAASKKKGMWMGGNVPLGYDTSERTLIINPAEAKTVRRIFALYLEFGCVRRVKQEADQLGLSTKRGMTAHGCQRGGKPLSRGHIYRLLSNPIYIGQIAHKGQLYPGQHPALIDAEMWTAVQDQLVAKARGHRSKVDAAEPSLLTGMLTDAHGNRFTPSHAVRSGRRYRYYISAAPLTKTGEDRAQVWFACGPRRYHEILERLKANGVSINAGPLLVIPPAIHSFYFLTRMASGWKLPLTSTGTRRICKSSDLAAWTRPSCVQNSRRSAATERGSTRWFRR